MKAKTLCIAIGVLMLVGVLIAPTYALPVPRYVIITTNEIVSNSQQLENFIAMKTHQGFRVTVGTENDFDGLQGQLPNGKAERIRQWLINNYEELNIKYVLLIGDPHPEDIVYGTDYSGDIPMKRCWHSYFQGGTREGPTDFFYADLNSNWNYDGDDFFGEIWPFEGKHSPDPAIIGEDNFSVKWDGKLKCDSAGTHKITTWSDGGVLVLIDGEEVICDECISSVEHLPSFKESDDIDLSVGLHDIEIWYRDYTGDAFIHLAWTPPGGNFAVIPKDNLLHQGGLAGIWQPGGLKGDYFGNVDFIDYKFSRIDETIQFSWFRGDMSGFDPNPEPEVYVGRIPVYLKKKDSDDEWVENVDRFTDLDSILQKIIDYETDDSDIVWRKSLLLPISLDRMPVYTIEYANKIKDEIADPMTFTSTRIYPYGPPFNYSNGSPIPIPEITSCDCMNNYNTVTNEWRNGYGMVVWSTHGSSVGADWIMRNEYLHGLDDSKPSFTFHASCSTGTPEHVANLSFSLLKKGDGICECGGGIANVAGSRMTTASLGGSYASLAYPHYTRNVITHGMPAGMALDEAKADSFYTEYPLNVDKNDMLFNLYGDPNTHLLKTFPMQVVENPICGDANCDGLVDNLDYWYMHPWTALQICKKWAADVNCDGAVTLADAEFLEDHLETGEPLQCCLDLSIPIKTKLYGVRNYITNLPDTKFARNAVQLKKAISNKFYAVHELVDTGYYEGAYMKIENDIISKMDGLQKDDWITDPGEQVEICGMLDGIKADLAVLMDQPK